MINRRKSGEKTDVENYLLVNEPTYRHHYRTWN